jgi:hypothetical protein
MPKKPFKVLPHAIRHSLSYFPNSGNEKDGDDEENDEEDSVLGKLSRDDEPYLLMGTISKQSINTWIGLGPKQMLVD